MIKINIYKIILIVIILSSSFCSFKQAESEEPTRLSIHGRKLIGIEYEYLQYLSTGEGMPFEKKPVNNTTIDQELGIKVEGSIGKNIFVNLNYNDTLPPIEQQKIFLNYKGEKDGIIQKVTLGDIQLSLPWTEFIAQEMSLLGVKIIGKSGEFKFIGLGSLSRGVPGSKSFTGKALLSQKEIFDAAYLKRKYYKPSLKDLDSFLPLKSVEIYIDDRDGSNNTRITQKMTVTNDEISPPKSYTGDFDKQYSGEDYIVNYSTGMIEFSKNIKENYVIALAYKDKEEKRYPSSGYRMIKEGQDLAYQGYEIKNYYFLGARRIQREGFILQILDINGNPVFSFDNPEISEYRVKVDYESAVIKITRPSSPYPDKPFPQAYPPESLHKYTIYTEYKHLVDIYLLQPDIIPGSERVYLNGKLLTRQKDYLIDYSCGLLTFTETTSINEESKIKIDYEWMPFAGKKASIFGIRGEYSPGDNFSLGSTFFSQQSPRGNKAPHLDSAPFSQKVMGVDTHFNLYPEIKLGEKDVPLDLQFWGEIANNLYNPNTFGRAIVEDFDSTKVFDEVSMDKDAWKMSSNPPGKNYEERGKIKVSNENIPGDKINPSWSENERKIMVFTYEDFSGWNGRVYLLSSSGKDYTQRDYLELWIKNEDREATIHLDLGVISEDADGDGILDTEDKNGDGKLNPGEDTGINLGGKIIGKDNGKLDTEDLDGDGRLGIEENFSSFILSDYLCEEPSPPTGWCRYLIPLKDAANWDLVKQGVKHLRIWIKGENIFGNIKFASILISGDRWKKYNLEIKAINNKDDPQYNPFKDSKFCEYYKEMYGKVKIREEKWEKEGALSLIFNLEPERQGWAEQIFSQKEDWSCYETLNFWIYIKEIEGEGNLYLRFGSDIEEGGNYYEVRKKLKGEKKEWQKVSIPLSNLSIYGVPCFEKIKGMRVGISNNSIGSIRGIIYLNDIFLSEVKEKSKMAKRAGLKINFDENTSFSGEYKKLEGSFQTIGSISPFEETEVTKIKVNLCPVKFLPFSYEWNKDIFSNKRVISKSYKIDYLSPSFPRGTLEKKEEMTSFVDNRQRREEVYRAHLLLPNSISSTYENKKVVFTFPAYPQEKEEIEKWEIRLPFYLFNKLNVNPVYVQSKTRKGEEKRLFSKRDALYLESRFPFFNLSSHLSFSGGCEQNNFSKSNPYERDLFTYSDFSLNLPLPGNLYSSFKLKKRANYEDTTSSLDFFSLFGVKELDLKDGEIKVTSDRTDFNLKGKWPLFGFLDLELGYREVQENKVTLGTPYFVKTITFPEVNLNFNLLKTSLFNNFFLKNFTFSSLTVSFFKQNIFQERICSRYIYQPSLIWRGNLREPQNLNVSLKFKSGKEEKSYFGEEEVLEDSSSFFQLKANYPLLHPLKLKIPLFNFIINLERGVSLSCGLSFDENKSFFSSGKVNEDNSKYRLSFDVGNYRIGENLWLKLGINGVYFKNKLIMGKDYFSLGGRGEIEIKF